MKWLWVLSISVLLYLVVENAGKATDLSDCDPKCQVYVSRVIDGDTFVVNSGSRIRISGYDAPELGEAGGYEAKACLTDNIEGKTIRISLQGRDYYNRHVATVLSHRITC